MKVGGLVKVIIQDEISITQEEVDETIKHYEDMPSVFRLGILEKVLDKNGIIYEIKKLSALGKEILLMHYRFKIYTDGI